MIVVRPTVSRLFFIIGSRYTKFITEENAPPPTKVVLVAQWDGQQTTENESCILGSITAHFIMSGLFFFITVENVSSYEGSVGSTVVWLTLYCKRARHSRFKYHEVNRVTFFSSLVGSMY